MKESNYPIRTDSTYDGCNIIEQDNRPVFHDQCLLRNGDVPHPAGDGHIRAAGLPLDRDEVAVGNDPGRRLRFKGDQSSSFRVSLGLFLYAKA